ncbi:MAG: alanyl-tRNA editing protein [Chloroflexia bacterium]|nr:alanyl-tRNA editing protein [Chloroflexia bacterium]
MTILLYHHDAFLRECTATVIAHANDDHGVILDQTVCYATSGGQPHDTGTMRAGSSSWQITDVKKTPEGNVHILSDGELPAVGTTVTCVIDWERRYRLMRTHTALHLLCGVVFRDYGAYVTGGNMDLEEGRLDFEIADFSNELAQTIVEKVNVEVAANRPIEVKILPRDEAFAIPDLIRTKISLLPEGISEVRTVNIVGLDLQADGGTHVAHTSEVGQVTLLKTRSKGATNKRIIIGLQP